MELTLFTSQVNLRTGMTTLLVTFLIHAALCVGGASLDAELSNASANHSSFEITHLTTSIPALRNALDDLIRKVNGDRHTDLVDVDGGGEIDRENRSSPNSRLFTVDYATIPASLESEEAFAGRINTCEGECSFLINFGTQADLVSRDAGGYLTEAIVVPRSDEIEASIFSIDIRDQGIDVQRFPILRISNRVFAFIEETDGSHVIVPGSISKQTAAMGGGTFNPGEQCSVVRIQKDIMRTDQGDSYCIEWTECDQESCLGSVVRQFNCQPYSQTLSKKVAKSVFQYSSANCKE